MKNIRLTDDCYSEKGRPFFITISTYDRRPLFINDEYAKTVTRHITKGALGEEAELYAYCLMPDHLHLLIAPEKSNLIGLIGRWKSFTTSRLQKHGITGRVWQRGFYDHALRAEDAIADVVLYIVYNPVRKGIVVDWRDYPYSWHKG